MAIISQGVELYWSTSTANCTSTACRIDEVVSWNGPSGAAAVIDITHLLSTAKEKLLGLRDEGQVNITAMWLSSNLAHMALRADRASRTKRKCVIKLNDAASAYFAFDGYCSQYAISGAVDDKIMANIVIEIDGPVTYVNS